MWVPSTQHSIVKCNVKLLHEKAEICLTSSELSMQTWTSFSSSTNTPQNFNCLLGKCCKLVVAYFLINSATKSVDRSIWINARTRRATSNRWSRARARWIVRRGPVLQGVRYIARTGTKASRRFGEETAEIRWSGVYSNLKRQPAPTKPRRFIPGRWAFCTRKSLINQYLHKALHTLKTCKANTH